MSVEIDELALRAAFSQPDDDGTFRGEFADYLQGIASRRPVLLFAFPPKAAGTFLRTAAIAATGGQLVRAVHAQGGREAQLYLPVFIHYYYGGVCEGPMVVHVHMQAHPANCRFIEVLNLKPVIMLRSIPDMLASMWDMYDSDPAMRLEAVNCMLPDGFPEMAREDKADYMVDMFGPWYASYYASWQSYAAEQPGRVLIIQYTDIIESPDQALSEVLAHAGLVQSPEVCLAAWRGTWEEKDGLRFNKGVAGRGHAYFTDTHYQRLARMLSYYPGLKDWLGVLMQ